MASGMKFLNKRQMGIAAAAIVAAGAGAFFVLGKDKTPKYETSQVTRGDLEVTISASGKVQPKDYVDVGAQVSGQLQVFTAEIGEKVEKGDLLAQIDETVAAAKVEADRAQLKELQASASEQAASLELARAEAARAEMMYGADAISKAEYQSAIASRKIAEARQEQLKAQIERQSSTLAADLANLEFTKIYAPMSGTVVSQSAVVGQTLNANQTTPTILRIADLSVMTVEADVSEADVLRVAAGQEAYFTTLGSAKRKWETSVRQVLPQPEVVNDVVLYKALLDVENADEALKPEMTAQVFFVTGRATDAILAPIAALRDAPTRRQGQPSRARRDDTVALMAAQAAEPTGQPSRPEDSRASAMGDRRAAFQKAKEEHPDAEEKMVLLMVDGEPQPRPVLVGIKSRTQAEILFGLAEGDEVVIGEVDPSAVKRSAANRDNGGMRPPPGMSRRGPR